MKHALHAIRVRIRTGIRLDRHFGARARCAANNDGDALQAPAQAEVR